MTFLHGGDFVSSGCPEDLKWPEGVLKDKYSIKTTTVGEDGKLALEVRILNRIVRWHPGKGVTIEADPRHVEMIMKDAGTGDSRTLSSTGARSEVNDNDEEDESEGELLEPSRSTAYRSATLTCLLGFAVPFW